MTVNLWTSCYWVSLAEVGIDGKARAARWLEQGRSWRACVFGEAAGRLGGRDRWPSPGLCSGEGQEGQRHWKSPPVGREASPVAGTGRAVLLQTDSVSGGAGSLGAALRGAL